MPRRALLSGLRVASALVVVGSLGLSEHPALAQVAFAPVVSAFPNGVTLPVTPVVSADRRYVRLSMSPTFTGLEGFDTYSVPAAVSGGPGGPGALGGLGGGGQRFAAGMDGVTPFDGGDPRGFLASGNGAFPTLHSPDATALLSGMADPISPPRLSAGMQGDLRQGSARDDGTSGRFRAKPSARAKTKSRVRKAGR